MSYARDARDNIVNTCVVKWHAYMLRQVKSVLFINGHLIDPANHTDRISHVLVEKGKVSSLGSDAAALAPPDAVEIDIAGMVICPGLIDGHVHLREPGQSAKETISTGSLAAAKGGFTSLVCMPNTSPPIDNPATVVLIREKADRESVVNIFVAGAISKNLAGEEMAPIGSLKQAGVVAITDDGRCVQNGELMRRALEYARMFELVVLDHCQDYALVTEGVVHEGYWSTVMGLRGWPAIGEESIVARNILLAELTGAQVHCQHISSAGSVRLLREAKHRGIRISGEACPHHFTLTDSTLAGSEKFWAKDGGPILPFFPADRPTPIWPPYDTNFKMNPPLRSPADREAVLGGIIDGTLEVLASDHAPHCDFEKDVEFDYAPFGITGLETELALSLMQLVHTGRLALSELVARFTINPARLLNLPKGKLSVGDDADITVFDPCREWIFERSETCSKSFNSPFYGWTLKGKATLTMVGGKVIWQDTEAVRPGKNHELVMSAHTSRND